MFEEKEEEKEEEGGASFNSKHLILSDRARPVPTRTPPLSRRVSHPEH
jgi:hypothetical protein